MNSLARWSCKYELKEIVLNVILLLEAIFIILGFFYFINSLGIMYPVFVETYLRLQLINLKLLSPYLDLYMLYMLSVFNILLSFIIEVRERNFKCIYLNIVFLVVGIVLFQHTSTLLTEFTMIIGFINMFSFLYSSKLLISAKKIVFRILTYVCFVFILIDLLSVILLVIYPFYPFLPNARRYQHIWRFVELEAQTFFIPSGWVPLLILLLFLTWPIKPLLYIMNFPTVCWGNNKSRVSKVIRKLVRFFKFGKGSEINFRCANVVLIASVALSMFYILYPFLFLQNPFVQTGWVDLPRYVAAIREMGEVEGVNVISYSFMRHGDRFISLLVLFFLWKVTGLSLWTVVKFTPLLIAPLLVSSAYFFMRHAKNDSMSVYFTPFLTASSVQMIVGFGLGFLSNFMALILLFLFSGLLLKALGEGSWRGVVSATLIMVLLLFTHAWTWAMLIGILTAFTMLLAIRWLRTGHSPHELTMISVIITSNIAVDLIKNYALYANVGFASEAVSEGVQGISALGMTHFWSILNSVIHTGVPFYNNPLLVFLAFLGSILILSERSLFNDYMISWLGVTSFPFIFGSRTIKYRILYNLPLQFLAAVALSFIMGKIRRHAEPFEGKMLTAMVVTVVLLMNMNYVLRCFIKISGYMG